MHLLTLSLAQSNKEYDLKGNFSHNGSKEFKDNTLAKIDSCNKDGIALLKNDTKHYFNLFWPRLLPFKKAK